MSLADTMNGVDDVAERVGKPDSADGPLREEEWVRRARSGDLDAFNRLVDLHSAPVFALVKRIVCDEGIAEELTQDTFVKAYRGLGGFREQAAFSTWLYRIALNHVRDYLASRRARQQELETSMEDPAISRFEFASADPNPEERVCESEMWDLFRRAVHRLELRLLEAFLLRHQHGLSYREIAEILRVSVANAKVRVHRARKQILGELRAQGYCL